MRLPDSLLQEIKAKDDTRTSSSRWPTKTRTVSRKVARKQERASRKQKRAEFHDTRKRSAPPEHPEYPHKKRLEYDGSFASSEGNQLTADPSTSRMQQHRLKSVRQATPTSSGVVSKPKSQIEEDEEAYIAYLEAKLGNSGGHKTRKTDADGLDDLLAFADSVVPGVTSRAPVQGGESHEKQETGSENDEEEWKGIESLDSEDEDLGRDGGPSRRSADPAERSTLGKGKYAPPHLRKAGKIDDLHSEENVRLTKQLKGLLNRMSEQNLAAILDDVMEIYCKFRRHDVTVTLTKLVITNIANHATLLDSYVVLHAGFISSMHRLIGVEFAAFFVQSLTAEYENHYTSYQTGHTDISEGDAGKEALNLIAFISELYNFQVIASVLVYDIIRSLLRVELRELNVELLLKMLRNSGQQLRQDDPSALKDIVAIVQTQVTDKEGTLSSRTRFMLETLTNLKNNKLKSNVSHDQSVNAVERMKRFLSGLSKRHHLVAHDALRMSLVDLRSAEGKGKWWLTGAGWAGDPLVDRRNEGQATSTGSLVNTTANERLLKLAKKQGMNTDIRRSVFIVLMSSDDYVHACERLSQLSLTEVQQREIVRVLLHCCGNEKPYNPYYTLICQHLCRTSHAYKITLQFCFWDFLRDLGELNIGGTEVIKNMKADATRSDSGSVSKRRLENVARAYGWWIAKDSVSLTILKPIDFTVLKSQAQEFLRELLISIFLSSQATSPVVGSDPRHLTMRDSTAIETIFIKATRIETLAMGLFYFITEFKRGSSSNDEELMRFATWASGVAKDTLQTGLDIVPTL